MDRGCDAERETILYLTQTWELKHGFAMVFVSEMFDMDQRIVETCPPESRGRWRDKTASCKDCKNQQYSFYETFISLCVSVLEQG